MCGIAGIVGRSPLADADERRALAMCEALRHRGPDDSGEYRSEHVVMAMRRLSIIDLAGGHQPLFNEDRSLVLVANGEIYNFVELRATLEAGGHAFHTNSDCETILHLYEEHGSGCVDHLRGMFAFALWDTRCKRLVLARDRMGEKPLYLAELDGRLAFASELRALLSAGVVPFELDPVSVDLYLHYQYVPEPRTPVCGVRKLDAATVFTVDTEAWRFDEHRYWNMEDADPVDGEPGCVLREELERVGGLLIRSDVPVGVALSGGLDSSAIAALAVAKYPGTMHAFTVGYPGGVESDERADARALAEHLGMPFHEAELATDDMVALFADFNDWRDDPIADIAGYGYYAVMKLAREHDVPVVLQGQGGDELFWGYGWVRDSLDQSRQKQQLRSRGWLALPQYLDWRRPSIRRRDHLREWVRSAAGARPGWQRFRRDRRAPADQMVFYDLEADFGYFAGQRDAVLARLFRAQVGESAACDIFTFEEAWTRPDIRLTRLIIETYLRENGIAQGDRLSMASSVELRLPFVDHVFVEKVIGLRKARPEETPDPKAWLRDAVADILPQWVMDRPKRGFTPPTAEWREAIRQAYGARLDGGYLEAHGIVDPAWVRAQLRAPALDQRPMNLFFKVLVLEMWCRSMQQRQRAA